MPIRKSSVRSKNGRTPRGDGPRVKVKKSRVHGRGVFARKPFRRGERIMEYTGRRIRWSTIPQDLDDPRMYFFGLGDGKRVIDPRVGGNEARFVNHSCNPNCETRESRGRVFVHAVRNIRPGEELTYDYCLGLDDDVPRTKEIEDEARCYCRSPKCRGTMLEPAS